MMRWEDPTTPPPIAITAQSVDVRYRIRCPALPVDHAHVLREALLEFWPWLAEEDSAGIHTIHGAESGNGWIRPEDPASYLPLSRRTRLVLRLPRPRVETAQELCDTTLQLGPDTLEIQDAQLHPLQVHETAFARYIAIEAENEDDFLAECAAQLQALDIHAPRMLAGRMHTVANGQTSLLCRSLMLDGLKPQDSIRLQELGLGPHRLLGCGLFLPHKSIAAVGTAAELE